MESRLLAAIVVPTGGWTLPLQASAYTNGTATIPAGTYWLSDDGSGTDFLAAIKTAFEAALSGSTFTVDIIGMGVSVSGKAYGRLRISIDSGQFTEGWGVAHTADPRFFGWPEGHATNETSGVGGNLNSDYVALGGWYPRTFPLDPYDAPYITEQASERTVGGYIDAAYINRRRRWIPVFPHVADALAARSNGLDSLRAGDVDLETGDEHASFESLINYAVQYDVPMRYYPDITDTATFYGPTKLPADSDQREMPLTQRLVQRLEEAMCYTVGVELDEVP